MWIASALDTFAIVCTWVFGVVGLLASLVTVQTLWNRPRVDARWVSEDAGETDAGETYSSWEGLVVEVRPRQRPVRIERLEVELRYGQRRGWRRRRSAHFFELSSHPQWPHVLQDGEVMEAHRDIDEAVDEAHRAIGDARLDSSSRILVRWGHHRTLRVRY
jgi:hypothetical protein